MSKSAQQIALINTPEGYNSWFVELKERIHSAQQRASLAVNQELVLLYWQIVQQVVEQLSCVRNLYFVQEVLAQLPWYFQKEMEGGKNGKMD